jgi:hypothetical protein
MFLYKTSNHISLTPALPYGGPPSVLLAESTYALDAMKKKGEISGKDEENGRPPSTTARFLIILRHGVFSINPKI